MDGLSAAASVAGVISLAMQLGQAARSLIAFLDTIADAPKEIARLKDLLLQIAAICSGVRSALEYQSRLHSYAVPGADDIYDALLVCQRKLVAIQEVLDQVEDVRAGRTLVTRNWAKFKLAVKKDGLLELERQLSQALAVLNVLLTTNLLTLVIVDKIDALTPQCFRSSPVLFQQRDIRETADAAEVAPDDGKAAPLQSTAVLSSKPPTQGHFVSVSTARNRYSSRVGLLQIQTKKKRRTYRDDGHARGYETNTTSMTYSFRPTILSWSVEIMIMSSGCRNPSISLRLKNIMQPGVRNTLYDLYETDDVRGLQSLFSKRLITIDMETGSGFSLAEGCPLGPLSAMMS
ncbi:hypothetical protein GQ53DRAFT_880155 [Thozetella sp. PMI_491]|nr:hypothetical protein GQ53DRAFT_880155 [Thozetella sp. PMI_491]